MTMLDDCPGLCAKVYVDNMPLEEYTEDTEPETANMTTVYIRSKTGKQFAIRYSVGRPFSSRKDILAKVFLDGKWVASSLVRGQEIPHYRSIRIDSSLSRIGTKSFQQRFSFSPLSINKFTHQTEERLPVSKEFIKKVSEMGTIMMTFTFCEVLGECEQLRRDVVWSAEDLDAIPEKSMKSDEKSHEARLGKAKPMPGTQSFYRTNNDDGPFATYGFKYRSLKSLYALHIVPGPVPLEDRDPGELSIEETRELLRIYQKHDTAGNIKQEHVQTEAKRESAMRNATRGDPMVIESDSDDSDVEIVEPLAKRRRDKSVTFF